MAEAVTLMRRRSTAASNRVIVDADCLPQTMAVLQTRLGPLGIEVVLADLSDGLPERRLLRRGAAVSGRARAPSGTSPP